MKRFAALALASSLHLTAVAGNPVSVYPPSAPAKPANSLSQPLSTAVQSAAATMPAAPPTTMTSNPSWGTPTVLPGTLVAATTPCGSTNDCQVVKPYFNPLAARAGCDVVRGTCLDRLKDWFNYRPTPGSFPCGPTPYRAPLRAYFPCKPTCDGGGCGPTGCASGGCARGGNCGPVTLSVQKLEAGCDTPVCRPRVMYQPLSARSEVPAFGCDASPVRPRLFQRLFSIFTPKCWGALCDDTTGMPSTCSPSPPPAAAVWNTPNPTGVTPGTTTPVMPPPMSTTPIYGPGVGKPVTAMPSPAQPFTNP